MTTMMMMNEFPPPRVLESLDSIDAFHNSFLHFLSHELLDKFDVIDFDGAVNLETDLRNTLRNILNDHTNHSDLENRQHQTESVYINLEADDECVNYSKPPCSVSDIADVTLLRNTLRNILDDHTNNSDMENRQNQTESVYINLEADDECVNYSTPSCSVSDIVDVTLMRNTLRNILDDHTNNSDLENRQHQTESVYINLEADDECVDYSTPPCSVSDIADVTLMQNTLRNILDDHTNNSDLENRQHQTESVYINLEADDECVNYSTLPCSVSDIAAADATFLDIPTPYFPDFQEPFTEFVYPKGDPDAVCLTKSDVDLLKPDTYINDTIIDFYILYLKNKIKEKEKARVHFFNSFFFPKLAGMDKNAPYACDRKSAFQSVRKWTRKVNLFEKDYIFIPVNFKCHWSLIVICYPGEVVNINDTEPEKSLRLPCILHMDSMKGYHSGLKDLVQSYLCEEWKERKKDACGEDLSSRFLNMRFLPVEVPQQENSYDCGLFLLHHLELFLADVPFNFNPFRITKFSNFLNSDWFPPAEASLKRTFVRRLIFELMENHGSHEDIEYDVNDSAAPISNLPDDPLIYFSPNTMCAGNRNWSPTLQLHQDFWEEQPTKKRRL